MGSRMARDADRASFGFQRPGTVWDCQEIEHGQDRTRRARGYQDIGIVARSASSGQGRGGLYDDVSVGSRLSCSVPPRPSLPWAARGSDEHRQTSLLG